MQPFSCDRFPVAIFWIPIRWQKLLFCHTHIFDIPPTVLLPPVVCVHLWIFNDSGNQPRRRTKKTSTQSRIRQPDQIAINLHATVHISLKFAYIFIDMDVTLVHKSSHWFRPTLVYDTKTKQQQKIYAIKLWANKKI